MKTLCILYSILYSIKLFIFLQNLFQTGNVIQLISRSSRRALQIVQAPDGRLVVDGMGPPDPHATNSKIFNIFHSLISRLKILGKEIILII